MAFARAPTRHAASVAIMIQARAAPAYPGARDMPSALCHRRWRVPPRRLIRDRERVELRWRTALLRLLLQRRGDARAQALRDLLAAPTQQDHDERLPQGDRILGKNWRSACLGERG